MSILERRPPALKRTLHATPSGVSAVERHASVQNRCGGEGCLSIECRVSCFRSTVDEKASLSLFIDLSNIFDFVDSAPPATAVERGRRSADGRQERRTLASGR